MRMGSSKSIRALPVDRQNLARGKRQQEWFKTGKALLIKNPRISSKEATNIIGTWGTIRKRKCGRYRRNKVGLKMRRRNFFKRKMNLTLMSNDSCMGQSRYHQRRISSRSTWGPQRVERGLIRRQATLVQEIIPLLVWLKELAWDKT